jgi:ATP-dependent helicase/nuclease subunit B
LLVEAAWSTLSNDGYPTSLERTANLTQVVYDSLVAVRLAGLSPEDVSSTRLENDKKAADLVVLLKAYDELLSEHRLVDETEIYRRAIARLKDTSADTRTNQLVLIPSGFHVTGLERAFLESLSGTLRIDIAHPVAGASADEADTDVQLLAHIGESEAGVTPVGDGMVAFFRSVGECNEIREVFRRCLAEQLSLDDVELLHTDTETYVPLINAVARRFFAEPDRPGGAPVTFAEGLPASLSRPGRALTIWQTWIAEGYPQRLLVEMIGEGLLQVGDEDDSFSYLARLLRPIGISHLAENYLPKLDEQIKASRDSAIEASKDIDAEHLAAAHERKLKALTSLRGTIKRLLKASHDLTTGSGSTPLVAAEEFLVRLARSVSEMDRYAAEALIEQVRDRRLWLERLDVASNVGAWLAALPGRTRILGSGPRPGHLHVGHAGSGGQSGRKRTFVVGLDDRRFPGASLQDPILLDGERHNLTPELTTSAARMRHKIDDLAATLGRLSGTVTLSWSCQDLADDRETFPSPFVLSAFRLVSGQHDADLEALSTAVGSPVSFAPTGSDKSLDESELWLWRLSDEELQGTNQLRVVESHFPHLARGSHARLQRAKGFGPFNGRVPQAGVDLNPFRDEAPVLSASALETAGRCPLAFFFRNALGLHPPDELDIDPDVWLDARQFGLLLHEVFRGFMAELSAAGEVPQFERDHRRLSEILRKAVDQWRADVPPPNESAFRKQLWQLVRTSSIFLQVEEESCQNSRPRYFEVALGLTSASDKTPLDDEQPSKLVLPGGDSILLRGQIDRVDEAGDKRYAVWDYKTGSGYGYEHADPFRQGRRVQSILYLRIIEDALRERIDPSAVVERFGYFFPGIRAHGLRIDWDANQLAEGMTVLEHLCQLVAEGAFPATDDADDCRYCDYQAICGDVQRVTGESRQQLDREDLVPLQHFRELRGG